MKFNKKIVFISPYCIVLLCVLVFCPAYAQDARFTVVIDAGHGGHDPGAVGASSREKDINLSVALQLGATIEQNYNDVKVIYTRKTDKYLTLQERADVVNNHHAELFICIHTNASPSSSAFGAETFTLGLAKSKANLDVAMRENSVILLEDDYRTKYKGFDPNSVESYIMFEFMQDKYIDKSVELASAIQKQFVNYCSRSDRGVRQAGFWVLLRSACPSVLVELGFISNPSEERFLSSDQGQSEMAKGVYNAFVYYKRDFDKKSGRQLAIIPKNNKIETRIDTNKNESIQLVHNQLTANKNVDIVKNEKISSDLKPAVPVFKVQLFAANMALKKNAADFKGVKNVDFFVEGEFHKYTLGTETEYAKIQKVRAAILKKFPNAFIIAFVGDKKITAKDALRLMK